MKERTTPDCRNAPSTTNLEEEEIVYVPGNDGNASMPEEVKRSNPWKKKMMMFTFNTPSLYIYSKLFAQLMTTAVKILRDMQDCSGHAVYSVSLRPFSC